MPVVAIFGVQDFFIVTGVFVFVCLFVVILVRKRAVKPLP
jgi:hypothetical protein